MTLLRVLSAAGTWLRAAVFIMILLPAIGACASLSSASTMEDLWDGKAHFEQIGEIDWTRAPGGVASEDSSWFVVRGGIWYAFSRVSPAKPREHCGATQMRVIVRQSRDRGKTWSAGVTAVEPGASGRGDGCAVLDGSSYFDAQSGMWHLLTQCLDRDQAGGWMLCHYTRQGASPMGRFVADESNPVVHGGSLWSRICDGTANSCARTTVDEGTPEIVSKTGSQFLVTFHGFDPATGRGFRGAASTPDFQHWQVKGSGLPGAPILGHVDCAKWVSKCVGAGAASILIDKRYTYLLVETMDKSLMCLPGQRWVFQLLRAPKGALPASGSGAWQRLPSGPLLTSSIPDATTGCRLQYARWIVDDGRIYVVYEDWLPGRRSVHRRLLQLVSGGGEAVQLD